MFLKVMLIWFCMEMIVLLFVCCTGVQTVSEMSFLLPLYGIEEDDIIKIDTVQTRYEKLYKVKYRR